MDKEEEITKRIEQLKRKNELLLQRHKEVEQDKKTAEKSGHSFNSKILTDASFSSDKKFSDKGGRSQSRAHMDNFDKKYEGRNMERHNHREHHSSESYHKNTPTDANRGSLRGRGNRGKRFSDYQEKRRENFRMMEEEMAQAPTEADEHNTSGVSRFLDDPRRKGELDPDQRWQSSRHKGSYGGLEFDNITRGMRGRGRGAHYRESRGRGRGMSRLQMSAEYTGRERQDQERWLAMREAADREIMSRSKTSQGRWRREWDAQKDEKDKAGQHDTGQSERYEEPRRTHRGGGRGKRGSGRGRRGSRNNSDSGDHRKEMRKEMNNMPTEEEQTVKIPPEEESSINAEEITKNEKDDGTAPSESQGESSKPQRKNRNKAKSPRHLVQQRAQTPSSKDGTEVWAQNSHHSDEAGHEWKNGSSRSAEQWLPSDEGNRNPAIDERLLEQQEDGATVYSRQLGRGWGNEKNIKATKAWVIDTEKAGATKQQPKDNLPDRRGRHGGDKHKDCRLRNVADERSEFRSASPRLRRGNPGLTVEVNKGGLRRVKHHSEGDPTFQLPEAKTDKMNTNTEAIEKENNSPKSVKSPVSAGVLKTPEGLKYVEDWALEMDIQSPTYKSRVEAENALQPDKKIASSVQEGVETAIESGSVKNDEASTENSSAGQVQKDSSTELSEHVNSVENVAAVISASHKTAAESVLPDNDETKLSSDGCEKTVTVTSQEQNDIEASTGIDSELADGNFKDAEEEVDDEFFECDGNDGNPLEPVTSVEVPGCTDSTITEQGSSQHVEHLEKTHEQDITAAANISSESIQVEVQETVQQHLISPLKGVDGVENVASEEKCVSKNDSDSCPEPPSGDVQEKDNEMAAPE